MFMMFFTAEMISTFCAHTNKYAWMKIFEKPSYAQPDGSWLEVTPPEMLRFIALLMYMGIVQLPRLHLYWNTGTIYGGLLPGKIMSRKRFFSLLAFLHVSDPEDDSAASAGKLRKVLPLLREINEASARFFQPREALSVDERMVKSKARSGIRQYIRDKVTKWGYKLWVLAESETGYTLQFFVYTGKRERPGPHGLAFDVVGKLCDKYLGQGYKIYMDNFYTSKHLFEHLLQCKTLACGTTRKDRRGFPGDLKDPKWEKKAERGDIRWIREGNVLFLQWKDRKAVSLMSTIHTANEHVPAKRRTKVGNKWSERTIRKPLLVHEYNAGMLGVDKSDQIIGTYNVLRKCVRWWKTLFFHCIDIACVNSFILFQEHRKGHPDIAELRLSARFDQLSFREMLIKQILNLDDDQPASISYLPPDWVRHKPEKVDNRRNCKQCYEKTKKEVKTNVFCSTCEAHLCFTTTRNCFADWHMRHGR
ncbi:piggyBac transposable element-derived protein 4-like [Dermacentor andersoni]|uniref:piggyBac transposable element-derived protein 4-like n=1 Tax=Dermacentor andersoni TaxID=34620 RepID=UPI003B3A489C